MKVIPSTLIVLMLFTPVLLHAQNNIKGTVKNTATGEAASAVSVTIKNSTEGTYA